MIQVRALASFEHGGRYRAGDLLSVPQRTAEQMAAKGLATIVGIKPAVRVIPVTVPPQAIGEPLSASPVAPALLPQTLKKSGRGGRRKKAAASS